MPYLGNLPAERFTSFDKQTITGNGGTSYTLDHAVGNEQEIEVFVNNVRQEPSVAYTVSGTALTMTGNVESTDDFYVVFQGKAIQTVTHPSNSALNATSGTFSGDVTAVDGTFSGNVAVDTDTLYVDSTNDRVGIGTTSPDSELHIATPTPKIHLRNTSDSNRGGFIEEDGTDFVLGSNSGVRDVKIKRDGSTGVHVEAGGVTTFPSNPMFSVRGNTSQWKSPGVGSKWYAMVGGATDTNDTTNDIYKLGVNWASTGTGNSINESCFSTSTGQFTAPADGFYIFSLSMYLRKTGSATSTNYMHPNPRINGSVQNSYQIHGYQSSGTATGTRYESGVNRTDILYLSKNDTFEWALYFESTNWQFYADYLRMSGGLIG